MADELPGGVVVTPDGQVVAVLAFDDLDTGAAELPKEEFSLDKVAGEAIRLLDQDDADAVGQDVREQLGQDRALVQALGSADARRWCVNPMARAS